MLLLSMIKQHLLVIALSAILITLVWEMFLRTEKKSLLIKPPVDTSQIRQYISSQSVLHTAAGSVESDHELPQQKPTRTSGPQLLAKERWTALVNLKENAVNSDVQHDRQDNALNSDVHYDLKESASKYDANHDLKEAALINDGHHDLQENALDSNVHHDLNENALNSHDLQENTLSSDVHHDPEKNTSDNDVHRDRSGSSASDIARRMNDLIQDMDLERHFKNDKLKREIMKHGRHWQDNLLIEKLSEANADLPEGTPEKECVIEVMEYCSEYCKKFSLVPNMYLSKEFDSCSFSGCRLRFSMGINMTVFTRSHVVIFLPGRYDWAYLSILRPRGQLWVFHSKESPEHRPDFTPPPELGNPFNLSITYMADSDIAHPYFYYQPNASDENLPPIAPKTRLVSWISSNCNKTTWNRMGLVHAMQSHVPIDTYGECGSLVCLRSDPSCKDLVSRFKFNLALENSQCPDYISEKFWFNALYRGTVPIVFGAPKEDYARLAPPHSFIHLDDFESPKDLAIYLKELDNNATRYLEYFAWRKTGTLRKGSSLIANRNFGRHQICYIVGLLVEKSFDPTRFPWQRTHPVFHDWWTGLCAKQTKTLLGQDISYTTVPVGIRLT